MLYKETPFTGYCIALATGSICGSFMHSALYCNAAIFLLSASLILNIIICKNRIASISYGLVFHCCIFFLGCSLSVIKKNELACISPGPAHFVVRTDNYPAPAARSLKLHTSIITVNGYGNYKNNRLLVYTNEKYISPTLKPGSIISFVSSPVEISDFDSTDDFDYRLFMNRRGFRYSAFCYNDISVIDQKPGIRHLGLRLRNYLLNRLKEKVDDEKSLAIVSAMTLGYRDLLDDRVREEFRKSGIVHIMAVSGLHVGIISMMILSLLKVSRVKSEIVKLLISLFVIWTYALMTGLSPSVTRASVMFSFLNTGYLINRPVRPINSVMASAFVILLINPDLLYEASFLLSYSAVIAIVANYTKLVSLVNFRGHILGYVWKMIAISLLAQAGTLPFVAFFFGEIPLFSVVSNLFAIPLATIILCTGFALMLFSSLPLIPDLLGKVLVYCVNTLADAASAIASINRVSVSVGEISVIRTVILFFFLLALITYLLERERKNLHIPLTIMILYLIIP
ncbi:MAG: ComEC/Rec2 family competence protein [Bacteroidales bacterium]|nr:ComEC/Rec2 family competence protein [Bacteroidales bacterium]